MANPQIHFRLDKDADRLLQLIVAQDGGDRADFCRAALAAAMATWLSRKAEQVQAQLGSSPVVGKSALGDDVKSLSIDLQEAA